MNRLLPLVLATLALAACGSQQAEAPVQQLTFHEIMKNEIDVRADEVWAIGNAAIDNNAGLDASKMSDAAWESLAEHSAALQQAALLLATLDPVVVVKDGVKIADEGVPYGDSAADVQASIDKNPQGMRDMANTLAAHMNELAVAARAHDAATAGPLINQLDSVCESCHLEYWYPSQKAAVENLQNSGVIDPTTDPAPGN